MSDGAADNGEIVLSSAESCNRFEERSPRVSSPTLVPSARPSSSWDHVISLLEQAAADKKAQSKHVANPTPEPSAGSGDESQATLKLLQELARKSCKDEQRPHAPVQLDTTLPADHAVVGRIDELKSADRSVELQPPACGNNTGKIARFAIAGCFAILAVGLAVWSQFIPAQFSEPRTEPNVTAAAPAGRSSIAAVQARPDIPSVQTMAECDLVAAKNPFAEYFLATPNALNSNLRQEGDLAWYSLMSLKARLERRGDAC